nr:MAG TPA: hypothetical protein [Caudoviricetes sp.]
MSVSGIVSPSSNTNMHQCSLMDSAQGQVHHFMGKPLPDFSSKGMEYFTKHSRHSIHFPAYTISHAISPETNRQRRRCTSS